MNLFKRLYKSIQYSFLTKTNPIGYARKLGVKIGDDCRLINFPMFGSEPYLIEIGNHVTISSDVIFSTHDGGTWVFRDQKKYKKTLKFGKIKIGNNCFIGTRTVIMPGVTIGDNCVVGACSLVTKSIPSGEVWGGVPAHFITTTQEYADNSLLNTPEYDEENFRRNRKDELLKIYNDK